MSYNIQRKQLQSPLSASYAETASYSLNPGPESDPIFVAASASLATTGSNQFSGSQYITGSLFFNDGGVTGSLFGTASWTYSASHALTASFLSTGTYQITSSWAEKATGANGAEQANEILVSNFVPAPTITPIWELDWNTVYSEASSIITTDPVTEDIEYRILVDNDNVLYHSGSNGLYVLGESPKLIVGAPGQIDGYIRVYGKISAYGIDTYLNSINFVDDIERQDAILATVSFNTASSNLVLTGGGFSGSFTGSLFGTASWARNALTSSWATNFTELDPIFTSKSGSYATTGSNSFFGNQVITGSLTLTQNLIVLGSSSITYLTASQLAVSMSYISVNVFEPQQRYGGLYVYDSGSSNATASLTWDSFNNNWVYTNQNGAAYSGGGLISGPRNTGSLGQETYPTLNRVVKGQGGDHITDSNITDTGTTVSINSNSEITGSLNVTQGITGSLFGTASFALSSSQAVSASFATTSSYSTVSVSSSFATTASFAATASSVTSASFATTATSASFITVTDTTTGTGPYYIMFVSMSTGTRTARIDSDGLLYNATTNTLSTTASLALTASYWNGVLSQATDVTDYTANTITDGYLLGWNSGSQVWQPTAGATAKGSIRLFIAEKASNNATFYFNAITVTALSSASPNIDTAFMVTSNLLNKVTLYLRSDQANSNSTRIDLYKNATGATFASATSSIANTTQTLTANNVVTFTFTGLTINQFDSIHIKVTPTISPSNLYGIVVIE